MAKVELIALIVHPSLCVLELQQAASDDYACNVCNDNHKNNVFWSCNKRLKASNIPSAHSLSSSNHHFFTLTLLVMRMIMTFPEAVGDDDDIAFNFEKAAASSGAK